MLYIIQLMSQYTEGKDQLGRLYKYTQFCSDNICDYKDLGRSLQLIVIQNQVQKMYKQFISQKQQRYSATLIICLILIIVAAGIAYASVRRYKKKIKDITDVTQDYQKQQVLISELQRESKTANDKINALEAEIERKEQFLHRKSENAGQSGYKIFANQENPSQPDYDIATERGKEAVE